MRQEWLGAVWMELKGQAGFSRHGESRSVPIRTGKESSGRRGYWHGGARYDGVWRVQAGMERRGESSYGLDRNVTAKQEWRV